jgi:hypothetical protein
MFIVEDGMTGSSTTFGCAHEWRRLFEKDMQKAQRSTAFDFLA